MCKTSLIKMICWGGGGICMAALLFFAASWIFEYHPESHETTCYDYVTPPLLPDTLTILCWNIGYAGLGDNMDFFYDGGNRVRDSRRRTLENFQDIIRTLQHVEADIMLLQEVDADSHRSYGIREVDSLRAAFPDYTLSFAYNYKAWWVPIPLRNPMGRVGSGLVTLSRTAPTKVVRLQYPSAFPFPVRLFNLKRCLLLSEFNTDDGHSILINNTHNTAYDTGGMRSSEMRFLADLLTEYQNRGIASITGGDWNQYPSDYTPSAVELQNPYFIPEAVDQTLFEADFRFVADASKPSLRYLDRPYKSLDSTVSQNSTTTLTDFFLVSKNLRILSVETLPLDFHASDHNPVVLKVVTGNQVSDTDL